MRSYATNSESTGYGAQKTLYTGSVPSTFRASAAIDINCESFTGGVSGFLRGKTSDVTQPTASPGADITEMIEFGILYGTDEDDVNNSTPSSLVGSTLKDIHIADAANGGLDQTVRFSEITDLIVSKNYWCKFYATSTMGVGYAATQAFTTSAACTEYYSCAWDADVGNRWSLNSDCSTADGDALVAAGTNAICYHRHDWLSAAITDLDADVVTEAVTRAMTVLPYRLVL